jgi:hypothetical protein
MKTYLRRSVFTKAVALGFIVMILLGNAWLVLFLTGQGEVVWLSNAMSACMVWTVLSGFGMGIRVIQHQFQKDSDDDAAV